MKKLSLALCLVCGLGSAAYAQEAEEKSRVSKRLEVYVEGNTGTLVNSTDGIFRGNELEFGLKYLQNFQSAPWLRFHITGSFLGTVNWNMVNNNTNSDQNTAPKWKLNGASGATFGGNYIEMGLAFSRYFTIAIRHNLFIKAYAYAPIDLPAGQTFVFLLGVEAFPYFRGQQKIGDIDGIASAPSLDALVLGFRYSISFAQYWGFSTELHYRTHGGGTGDSSLASMWEADSAKALRYNSYFRWDNTISYTNPKGISLWALVRYQPSYFVSNPLKNFDKRNGFLKNDVYLKFGITYFYDFSKL